MANCASCAHVHLIEEHNQYYCRRYPNSIAGPGRIPVLAQDYCSEYAPLVPAPEPKRPHMEQRTAKKSGKS